MRIAMRGSTVILAISALTIVGGGFVIGRQRAIDDGGADEPRHVANSADLTKRGFSWGPADARRTVVVFSDFECPFCRRFAPVIDSLRFRHPEVRVVERHWPLTEIHPFALKAALAAECARSAGAYERMRTTLFGRPVLIEEEEWGALAHFAGIADTAAISSCVRTERFMREVQADIAAAERVGGHGTPTVLVDDLLFPRPPTLAELERAIADARQ